ncbi:hypothetical protein VC87395_002429B, partial [Vibrio paracholerae 87395]
TNPADFNQNLWREFFNQRTAKTSNHVGFLT